MISVKNCVDGLVSQWMQKYISNNTMVGIWWHKFSSQFWAKNLWLPEGIEWDDLRSTDDFKYPECSDVFVYPLVFAVLIIIFKQFLLDPLILVPLANVAGISNKRTKPPAPNKTLERLYTSHGSKQPHSDISKVAQELEMSERQIERWFRRRRVSSLCTKYDKFLDCGFELVTHGLICLYGSIIMYNKPWLWNIELCWNDYPRHSLSSDIWWYYMLGLANYWAASFIETFLVQNRRSDSNQMMMHHLFTILLMVLSWSMNFVRAGTLILMVHEVADIPLLCTKMLRYAGIDAATTVLFVILLLLWGLTRCYLYPFWIMRNAFFNAPILTGIPVVIFCKGLLIGLLIMNFVWTCLIVGIVIKKFTDGAIEDIRSDTEEMSDDVDEVMKTKAD